MTIFNVYGDAMPQPGIYRITRNVKNPQGDKRVTRKFADLPVWPAGMRVVVRSEHIEGDLYRLRIFKVNGFSHDGMYLDLHKHVIKSSLGTNLKYVQAVRALLTLGVLEPEPVSLESELHLRHYENFNSPLLERLIKSGELTIAEVLEALDSYLKEDAE